MGRLIVNADNFGLTSGVNRAIIELHAAGLVTSTSLMARAGATDEAIELACATPSLGVGCHVVLVDGEPILPRKRFLPRGCEDRAFPGLAHSVCYGFLRAVSGRRRLRLKLRRKSRICSGTGGSSRKAETRNLKLENRTPNRDGPV